jgi:hypothetical protein
LRNRTNSDVDADHDDQLHDEDEENYRHRSINGRPPLVHHEGEGADDSEQPSIMMMTEESGGRLSSYLVGNEKPLSGAAAADNSASNQEIAQALEEDAMMERHDGSIQKILELLCLMGAGYWRLCQVSLIIQCISLVETHRLFQRANVRRVTCFNVHSFDAENLYRSLAFYRMFITIPAGFFTKKAGHTLKWPSTRMLNVVSK